MYTATLKEKAQNPSTHLWYVVVEFSNGTDTFVEKIYPQDKQGFEHWLKGKLDSLNNLTELIEEDNVGKVIEPTVDTPPEPTAEEQAKIDWFRDFGRLERVQRLIDLGVLTGDETPVVNLRNAVRTNFKATYLADM